MNPPHNKDKNGYLFKKLPKHGLSFVMWGMKLKLKKQEGQVMVLSVLMLGGILLGVSAFAGLLMVYQIRQANDALSSTKAFFAADAGIEWETYNRYKASSTPADLPVFSNGASVTSSFNCVDGECIIRAKGFSGRAVRALEIILSQ